MSVVEQNEISDEEKARQLRLDKQREETAQRLQKSQANDRGGSKTSHSSHALEKKEH